MNSQSIECRISATLTVYMKKVRSIVIRIVGIIPVLFMICSALQCSGLGQGDCAGVPDRNIVKMKNQLLRLIPIGSPIAGAEAVLHRCGFATAWRVRTDFYETHIDIAKKKHHRRIDFLYGDLERGGCLNPFMAERWQIAVVHAEGFVTDILISYGITGL